MLLILLSLYSLLGERTEICSAKQRITNPGTKNLAAIDFGFVVLCWVKVLPSS
jgi:hypothetical protein